MIKKKQNSSQTHLKKESLVAGIGIALEYYTVFLFGYLSFIIFPYFFQYNNSSTIHGIIIGETLAGICGAIVCGHIGDTLGRKEVLAYTIAGVSLPSFFISLLPGYDFIGIFATIAFTISRLVQILAFGGDMIGLVTFILEDAPPSQRGKFGGVMSMSAGIGACLASFSLYFADPFKNPASFWKWRLLLLFGTLGIFIAHYFKNSFDETSFFKHYKKTSHQNEYPIVNILKKHKKDLLQVLGISILAPIITIIVYAWIPQFTARHFNLSTKTVMLINSGSLAIFAIGAYFFGKISDTYGRKQILLTLSLFFLCFSYPMLSFLTKTQKLSHLLVIQAALSGIASAYYCNAMTACIEHIPTHIRYTTVAVGYYINYGIWGGVCGDRIKKFIIKEEGANLFPIIFLFLGAFVMFISSLFLKEKSGKALSDT
jgi:MFS transporter, MHS family, proline/betaine transporter